jgi:hypothetical protein
MAGPARDALIRHVPTVDKSSAGADPLATRLGLRPATWRTWERAGLLRPRRDPQTGYHAYSAADAALDSYLTSRDDDLTARQPASPAGGLRRP